MTEENGLEKIYSDGYNELKNDLKERYTAKVYAALKDVRETLVNRASAIFGDEFFSLLNESLLLETEKEKARRDFFSETDYENAQKELKSLRKKQQEEGGSEETNKALSEAISRVSTLNVTIGNRLKPYDEKLNGLREKIDFVVDEKKDDLESLKREIVGSTKAAIDEIVKNFNEELGELNETFGLPRPEEDELPFDESTLKLEIPISEFDPDGFMKTLKSRQKSRDLFVKSGNDNLVKN